MAQAEQSSKASLEIDGTLTPEQKTVFTPEALAFVADLVQRFGGEVESLLARRHARQARFDAGELPDFLPETAAVRAGDWTVAPLPGMPV